MACTNQLYIELSTTQRNTESPWHISMRSSVSTFYFLLVFWVLLCFVTLRCILSLPSFQCLVLASLVLLIAQTNFDTAVEPLDICKQRTGGAKEFERAVYGEHLVRKVLTNFVYWDQLNTFVPYYALSLLLYISQLVF